MLVEYVFDVSTSVHHGRAKSFVVDKDDNFLIVAEGVDLVKLAS